MSLGNHCVCICEKKGEQKECRIDSRLISELLKALSHPTRIRILQELLQGEVCVSNLMLRLGIEQSNLSQHLKIIREQGLIETRKQGNQVMYRIVHPLVLKIIESAVDIIEIRTNQLQQLQQVFERKEMD